MSTHPEFDRSSALGGRFTFPNTDVSVNRLGYGAMQLAGPGVWGPPRDEAAAIAVLQAAVDAGVDHIDTSDFYGPHVTNQIIRRALFPYPPSLTIVTKLGARRGADKSWLPAMSAGELTAGVHDNLRNLQVDALDVVNLRTMGTMHGPAEGSIAGPLSTLIELKQQGLIRQIGLSNVTSAQVAEARRMTDIVCVQNNYNVAHREDDSLIDELAGLGIAYVPFFPLGGFTPLQSLDAERRRRDHCRYPHASRPRLATATIAERAPDPRHLVASPPPGKPEGRLAPIVAGGLDRAE